MAHWREMPGLADEVLELRMAEGFTADPERAPTYLFDIMLRGTSTRVGQLLLRLDREDPGLALFAGHIGVEIAPEHRGQRHASRAIRLLGPLARGHGFTELWLTTSPDNLASRRTLERLGAQYVDTVEIPADSDMRGLGLHEVRRYRWVL
jgi:tagatose 1,6-diphosphate aldolase